MIYFGDMVSQQMEKALRKRDNPKKREHYNGPKARVVHFGKGDFKPIKKEAATPTAPNLQEECNNLQKANLTENKTETD